MPRTRAASVTHYDRRIIKLECLARLIRGGACKRRGGGAGCRRLGATFRKERRQRRCVIRHN